MGLKHRPEDYLRDSLGDVGFASGEEFYVPVSATARVLELCRNQALAVLGIEAFTLKHDILKPELDLIADFSSILEDPGGWDSIVVRTLEEARGFVGRVPPNQYLNFALLSEEEFQDRGSLE